MRSKRSKPKTKTLKKMKNSFKPLLWTVVLLALLGGVFAANTFNAGGEFSVYVEDTTALVYNNDIETTFSFAVTNNDGIQNFKIQADTQEGWDISITDTEFALAEDDTKTIQMTLKANSEFDYTPTVVSPDIVVISQQDEYIGFSEFPVVVLGENENISVQFSVNIEKPEDLEVSFDPKIANEMLSPVSPLQFTIQADDIEEQRAVSVVVSLEGQTLETLEEQFSPTDTYKIFTTSISPELEPGTYNTQVTVRMTESDGRSAQEWLETARLEVVAYENLVVQETGASNLFKESSVVAITNEGNVPSEYKRQFAVNPFNKLFLSANYPYAYEEGAAKFTIPLERGEQVELKYTFNYLPLYLLLLVIVILVIYIYMRKSSNPLDVETKIYDVKKVAHEGVKSMKMRIGFENIKADEIDTLKLIFRMPTYLQVKDDSFLLSPPKHALKGHDQYKLVWEFKRFGKQDSRILGFTLVNKRGVLGDIKLPPLELEVKIGGKVRKYYTNFSTIKG